jgi:hypothetical protein
MRKNITVMMVILLTIFLLLAIWKNIVTYYQLRKSEQQLLSAKMKLQLLEKEKNLGQIIVKEKGANDYFDTLKYYNKDMLGPARIIIPKDWSVDIYNNGLGGLTSMKHSSGINVNFYYEDFSQQEQKSMTNDQRYLFNKIDKEANTLYDSSKDKPDVISSHGIIQKQTVRQILSLNQAVVKECRYSSVKGGGWLCIKDRNLLQDGGFNKTIYITNRNKGMLVISMRGSSNLFEDPQARIENWIGQVEFND